MFFTKIKFKSYLLCVTLTLICAAGAWASALHEDFCYVDEVIPGAVYDVRYYGEYNFVGSRIDGYKAARIILTKVAASALAGVQEDLRDFGLGLKIYDGYRPQRAVNHFVRWAKDLDDVAMKDDFYPDVQKKNLFRDGYIAAKSGHSRGSTVDLTIIDLRSGSDIDMGTPFDYFGPASWPSNKNMSAQVRANRALLQNLMIRHGFKPLKEEWWHFTLRNEPYPDTYFDFPIE